MKIKIRIIKVLFKVKKYQYLNLYQNNLNIVWVDVSLKKIHLNNHLCNKHFKKYIKGLNKYIRMIWIKEQSTQNF